MFAHKTLCSSRESITEESCVSGFGGSVAHGWELDCKDMYQNLSNILKYLEQRL